MITGIILAAGNGLRFGKKKQFTLIQKNNYLFEFSLKKIIDTGICKKIILVIPPKTDIKIIKYCKNKYPEIDLVEGGDNRVHSIRNAVLHIKNSHENSFILLIDSSRPIINTKIIKELIRRSIKEDTNYVLIKKITDFLVSNKKEKLSYVDRNKYFLTHTPHVYKFKDIYKILKKEKKYPEIDTSMIMSNQKINISSLEIFYSDIKITYKEDLEIFLREL